MQVNDDVVQITKYVPGDIEFMNNNLYTQGID